MSGSQIGFSTKFGRILIGAQKGFVTRVSWSDEEDYLVDGTSDEKKLIKEAYAQIKSYLVGQRKEFDLPIRFSGTEFQEVVWHELLKIPFGETISYTELARRIDKPQAVRAVGSANGRNRLALLIPCHRVIGSSGNLCGYNGGIKIKESLVRMERFTLN